MSLVCASHYRLHVVYFKVYGPNYIYSCQSYLNSLFYRKWTYGAVNLARL